MIPLYTIGMLLQPTMVSYTTSSSAVVAGPSPIGWWKMNEGSGTTVSDSSGFGHTMGFKGSPIWTVNGSGYCLTFTGSAGMWLTGSVVTSSGASISVCAWINPVVDGGHGAVITQFYDSYGQSDYCYFINIGVGGNNIVSFGIQNPSNAAYTVNSNTSKSFIGGSTWHHVAGTYDGSTMRVYLDGIDVSNPPVSVSTTIIPTSASGYLAIAYDDGNYGTFTGSLDDVRIYNTALSSTQVASLFSGSAA